MAVIQGERQYQMVKLTLASGDSIETTAEHPFYIKGKGWNPASSLKVGQALQLHNGTTVVFNEIDTSVRTEKVYNLTVANTHNYFVGGDGVLVHNCKRGTNPLDETRFTDKVREQMRPNLKTGKTDNHGFPLQVDNFASEGMVTKIKGGDGIVRTKVELPGSLQGRDGTFEWIIEPDGSVNHRLFVPNR